MGSTICVKSDLLLGCLLGRYDESIILERAQFCEVDLGRVNSHVVVEFL